ncbi:MAG TPA: hypothetical protein VGS04_07410, partial [Nitrososphaerales archaeon]|nr:hypothetical protein [Nitrososphaerales archaeon]
ALPGSGVAFPILPYDAVYVITIAAGISGLTLDGVPVLFSVAGANVFVAAGHSLTPTYAGSPVFEVLPI